VNWLVSWDEKSFKGLSSYQWKGIVDVDVALNISYSYKVISKTSKRSEKN